MFHVFSARFMLRSTYRKPTWNSPKKIKPGLWMNTLLKFWVLYFLSAYDRVAFSRWGKLQGHLCFLLCHFSLFSLLLMGPVVLVSYSLQEAAVQSCTTLRKALGNSTPEGGKMLQWHPVTCLRAVVLQAVQRRGEVLMPHLLSCKGPTPWAPLLHIQHKKRQEPGIPQA